LLPHITCTEASGAIGVALALLLAIRNACVHSCALVPVELTLGVTLSIDVDLRLSFFAIGQLLGVERLGSVLESFPSL
jgi:hypothetical protein